MAKNKPIDPEVFARVTKAIRDVWVTKRAGFGERPADMAKPAIRRWQSAARRGVPADDMQAMTQDLARGLALYNNHNRRGVSTDMWMIFAEAIALVLSETGEQ